MDSINADSYWYRYDCSMVAYNLHLLAEEAGLGACWIGFAHNVFSAAETMAELGVEDNCRLVAPVAIGHRADGACAAHVPRKPFSVRLFDAVE